MGHAPFIDAVLSRWRSFRSRWTKHDSELRNRPAASLKDSLHAAALWSGLDAVPWIHDRLSSLPDAPHLVFGRKGERLAAKYLSRRGYKILHRNFRSFKGAEIDLVCREGEILVFVEVKTRRGEDYGRPMDAVDRRKRRRIARGAMAWLRMLNHPDLTFRFDVVEVVISDETEIRLIENAFSLPSNYYY